MSSEKAQRVKKHMIEMTPKDITESRVNISHDVQDMTGEVSTLVHVDMYEIPKVEHRNEEMRDLSEEDRKRIIEEQEEYQEQIRLVNQSIKDVAKNIADMIDGCKISQKEYRSPSGDRRCTIVVN